MLLRPVTRRLARLAIANINTTVCDVRGNLDKCIDLAQQAENAHCHVISYPEQTLGGYPAGDLSLRLDFVREQMQALLIFAEKTRNYGKAVHVLGLTVENRGQLFNCAAVVCKGQILGIVPKEHLPTYDEFYEQRTSTPGIPGRMSVIEFELDDVARSVIEVPFGDLVFDIKGLGRVAVVTCEDAWNPDGPMGRRAFKSADLIIDINSSPQRAGVFRTRLEMLATRSSDYLITLMYCNQVGGNDALLMDGSGFVFQCGRLLHTAPRFESDCLSHVVVDLDMAKKARMRNTTWRNTQRKFIAKDTEMPTVIDTGEAHPIIERRSDNLRYPFPAHRNFFMPAPGPARDEYLDEIMQTLLLSLEDYFRKVGVFKGVTISLSGGWDSALTLLLARRWATRKLRCHDPAAPKNVSDLVFCVGQPSSNNTDMTTNIARNLAEDCNASYVEASIQTAVKREKETLQLLCDVSELDRIAIQNLQARIRGERMWGVANQKKLLWLQTGNMSETFLGFTTIGGDQMGGFGLMGNLPKTVVMALVLRIAEQDFPLGRSAALQQLLHSKASPGLEPGQTTEKDLMPFIVLDAGMWLYLEAQLSIGETVEVLREMWTDAEFRAMDPDFTPELFLEWMLRLFGKFHQNIFKWVYRPLATHLGKLDLDYHRHMQIPIVHKVDWETQVREAVARIGKN